MKILKNKKAFTLTELIVVIAIIGILSAVLIPSLTGWIQKARESAASQEAQSYVTTYQAWVIDVEVNDNVGDFDEYCVSMDMFKDLASASSAIKPLEGDFENGFVYIGKGYDAKYDAVTQKITTGKTGSFPTTIS